MDSSGLKPLERGENELVGEFVEGARGGYFSYGLEKDIKFGSSMSISMSESLSSGSGIATAMRRDGSSDPSKEGMAADGLDINDVLLCIA